MDKIDDFLTNFKINKIKVAIDSDEDEPMESTKPSIVDNTKALVDAKKDLSGSSLFESEEKQEGSGKVSSKPVDRKNFNAPVSMVQAEDIFGSESDKTDLFSDQMGVPLKPDNYIKKQKQFPKIKPKLNTSVPKDIRSISQPIVEQKPLIQATSNDNIKTENQEANIQREKAMGEVVKPKIEERNISNQNPDKFKNISICSNYENFNTKEKIYEDIIIGDDTQRQQKFNSHFEKYGNDEAELISTIIHSEEDNTTVKRKEDIPEIKVYAQSDKCYIYGKSKTVSIVKLPRDSISSRLWNMYFPVSMSDRLSRDKLIAILKELNSIQNKDIHSNVLFYLLSRHFESKADSRKHLPNLFDENNSQERAKILSIIKSSKGDTQNSSNQVPFRLRLDLTPNDEKNIQDFSLESLMNNSLQQLLVNCYSYKHTENLIFFSMFGSKEDIFNILHLVFEDNKHLKRSDLYILFMLKSGRVSQLIKECKDIIRKKFLSLLAILLENYNYFDGKILFKFFNDLLVQHKQGFPISSILIMQIITGNFFIDAYEDEDTKTLSKELSYIFNDYLNTVSIEKLFITDCFNLIQYEERVRSKSDLREVGYGSILIKLRYIQLRTSMKMVDEKLADFASKVYENLHQLGLIHKDKSFNKNMRETLLNIDEIGFIHVPNKDHDNINQKSSQVIFQPPTELKENLVKEQIATQINEPTMEISNSDENKDLRLNNNSLQQPTKTQDILDDPVSKNKTLEKASSTAKSNNQQNSSFFTSAFKLLTGGAKDKLTTQKQIEQDQVQEEASVKKDDFYYDPKLKKYVIRGVVYDEGEKSKPEDQPEAKPTQLPPKKTALPPKISQISKKVDGDQTSEEVLDQDLKKRTDAESFWAMNSIKQPEKPEVISNPFGKVIKKSQPSSNVTRKPFNKYANVLK